MKRKITRQILRKRIYEGVLRGNSRGFAFLLRDDEGEDLFIPHRSLNGAQHGDRVKARIVKGDEAEVVSVTNRGILTLTGRVEKARGKIFIIPDNDNYYTDIVVNRAPSKLKSNSKVVVEIESFDKLGRPQGRITEVLGQSGEKDAEILAILINSGFSDRFNKKVLVESESLQEDTDYKKRKDYRDLLTITIDGEDAKDFDDAISIERLDGGYLLYVHIADVSHYVKEGSEIDKEAHKRTTSVYFPGRAYPMLPEKLSNGLCSLRPNEEKLTVTAKIKFDHSGTPLSLSIDESVICSNERMTYTNVQKILDKDEDAIKKYSHLLELVAISKALADKIKNKRIERGSIDFLSNETAILIEDGKIIGVEEYKYYDSNGIIEEFMIAANEAVARELERRNYPCIYRVHEPPEEEKVKSLEAYASGFGLMPEGKYLKIDEVSAFIKKCQSTEYAKLISDVAIRTMQKAEYRIDNIGHFGLASKCYCHFTSPIRRYPDLVVHRMLKLMLKGAKDKQVIDANQKNLKTAAHCSQMERAAEKAEREVIDYYKTVYMSEHIGDEAEGVISGVTNFSLFVMLDNGIEGYIPAETLPKDSYHYDPKRYTLKGERSSYRLGDKIKIRVKDANIYARKVMFEIM